ncbi:membrane fusion protein, multidrug efflux system [Marinobacter persicus]|uniref:Membrane fusion protein, multidrug efflux system n=1 Tax=Marinobacter persicus TaxID=930118 RepID=A0A1I3RPC7_9GAMM|nr:efflux RND transporter periplasmic adaptor subunit [Marinobacter persicus]GHD44221.1 hemolysin D [Marinobacter persicus]SFJ48454.1 membrane fusion protein, multidrug efflux system [Marinobacter persicus]
MTKAKWSSLGLSFLVILALVLWLATGDIHQARDQAPAEPEAAAVELPRVQVQSLEARVYQPTIRLQGQLQPWRTVDISARASGTVEQLHVSLGQTVEAGERLLTLSTDGRDTVVERWQASVRKLEADLAAARRLRTNNLAAENEILGLQSDLSAARAELTAARLTLEHLQPEAPFTGTINRRDVDPGTLVQVGSPLFELVQIERLKATAQVPQQQVRRVALGQAVDVRLLDGRQLAGEVRFVASAADPQTRSFELEVVVDNPEGLRVAGGSASLRILLPEQPATFISPAFLALDEQGRPGVKHVNADNRVVFTQVNLLSVGTDGAWVTGLPDEIRLITRGAGFVAEGERVEPVESGGQRS